MNRPALIFERLAVKRSAGIPGGFELEPLAPALNIIYGPNASGKTTTARALSALLWPGGAAANLASLSGCFTLDGAAWQVELEGARARYRRDGAEADPPALPPAAWRDRYFLSLHDLLSADNGDLAREIVRESAGGYDLAAAASALRLRSAPSRPTALLGACQQASERLQQARAAQEALQGEERRLRALEERAAAAERSAQRARLLDLARACARGAAEERAARAGLMDYPPEMAILRGDEADRLEAIGARLAALHTRLAEAERARSAADVELRRAALPDANAAELALGEVASLREAVRTLEPAILAHERELAAALAARGEAARLLGESVAEEALRCLDRRGLGDLAAFAREAGELRAEREALEAALLWLGDAAADPHTARTADGAQLLRQWLRSSGGGVSARERRLRALGIAAAITLLVGGGAAGLLHPGFFVLAAIGATILAGVLRRGAEPDERAVYRATFERLGGSERPAAWSDEEVAACLDRLERRIAADRLGEERAGRSEEMHRRLRALDARLAPLEARRRELVATFGTAPSLAEPELAWLAERVGRWQDADARVAERGGALAAARRQHQDALAAAARRLAPFGYVAEGEHPFDPAALDAALADLSARLGRAREARAALGHAEREHGQVLEEGERLEEERRHLLGRLGPEADEASVREWCERYEAYRAERSALEHAQRRSAEARTRLAAEPGYEPGLEALDPTALEHERLEAEQLAAELGDLRTEIGDIRGRIRGARESHDVETALADLARARGALQDARDADALAMVGSALVDFLQQATRDRHRPAVFHRARALFAQITRGRYRLDFEDGETPAFRAYDETTALGHSLEELSSATRVQLLMAVRIAFIEELEHGARLPILFDETLGNSDDQRAEAIIDAILTLAEEGRQLFYFTAQPDEVEKWRAVLALRPDLPAVVIDLAERRRLERHRELPRPRTPRPAERVPVPEGRDHAAYGARLQVPALDLEQGGGAIHLWYLVEEPEALYLILCLGVERWGELRALLEHGGEALLGVHSAAVPRIRAAARALEAALDLARIGRGRPVHPGVLADSGAVSDKFADPLAALAAECQGNAAALLAALEEGRVKGFQTRMRERLRDYLEEHGYVDHREPLAPQALRIKTLAVVAEELRGGLLSIEQVERMLSYLPAAAPAGG